VGGPEYLLVALTLIRAHFFLDFFGEVFAKKGGPVSIKVLYASHHDSISPAKGTMPFAFPRHLHQAPAAKHVVAVESHRPVGNYEANGAQVIIQLGNNGYKLGGHCDTGISNYETMRLVDQQIGHSHTASAHIACHATGKRAGWLNNNREAT
jgi:hypothetical protein